jgi:Fe-Mn family superoxide dismutase
MNKQIAGTELEGKSLEEIVMASWNNGSPTPVFNNAAQVRLEPVEMTVKIHAASTSSPTMCRQHSSAQHT